MVFATCEYMADLQVIDPIHGNNTQVTQYCTPICKWDKSVCCI
jgi:hypothetical protein